MPLGKWQTVILQYEVAGVLPLRVLGAIFIAAGIILH
jgi:hypothetical protein